MLAANVVVVGRCVVVVVAGACAVVVGCCVVGRRLLRRGREELPRSAGVGPLIQQACQHLSEPFPIFLAEGAGSGRAAARPSMALLRITDGQFGIDGCGQETRALADSRRGTLDSGPWLQARCRLSPRRLPEPGGAPWRNPPSPVPTLPGGSPPPRVRQSEKGSGTGWRPALRGATEIGPRRWHRA